MKGVYVCVALFAIAFAVDAAAPEPSSHVCVPDKWQAISFTRAHAKHKPQAMIVAKTAVDVDSQKAASEFVVFGGHHHKFAGRHELASEEERPESVELASEKHGKGVVKVIADFEKEKVYIAYHKVAGDKNITLCKVKDFDHPADLKSMLCLPEKAKKAGTYEIGGSLDVDMYVIKSKKGFAQVSLASQNNFPVSFDAVKKCGKKAVHTVYFNITKDIDEGFFDLPASCEGKLEGSLPKYFEHIVKNLKHQTILGNPTSQLLGDFDAAAYVEEHAENLYGKTVEKVSSFWNGMFGSGKEETIDVSKIRMYGHA